MTNGNAKTFSYHDLYDQVQDVEKKLNGRIDGIEKSFTDFREKNFQAMCDDITKLNTEMQVFKRIGYFILFGLGGNLLILILSWLKVKP